MTTINYYAPPVTAEHFSEDFSEHLIAHYGTKTAAIKALGVLYNSDTLVTKFENHLSPELKQELIATQVRITVLSAREMMKVCYHHPEGHFALSGACVELPDGLLLFVSIDSIDDDHENYLNEIVRHEMVHYHQMKEKRLVTTIGNTTTVEWDQKEYPASLSGIDPASIAQCPITFIEQQTTLPWELEAYGAAYDLVAESIHKGANEFYASEKERRSAIHDRWLDRVIAGDVTPGILPKAA